MASFLSIIAPGAQSCQAFAMFTMVASILLLLGLMVVVAGQVPRH